MNMVMYIIIFADERTFSWPKNILKKQNTNKKTSKQIETNKKTT